MSAAIMHTSLYDFGDFFLKSQSASRSIVHYNQQNGNNAPSPTNISTNLINNNNANNIISNGNTTSSQILSSMQNILSNGNTQLGTTAINNHHLLQQQQQLNGTTTAANVNSNLLSNNLNLNPSAVAAAAAAATSPALLQQHINAVVVAQQQQQQQQQEQQQKLLIHNALSRAVSHPQNGNVVSLMNLIENLNGHRKLERTQSEPLPQVNTSRYKTELCRPFEEAGECKYGEKCQFAHGVHELRNLQRHPKYKTEFCRTFHSVGFCPYGPRCHFVHNADEARHSQGRAVNNGGYTRLSPATVAAQGQNNQHPLPLSPPLSMSTGSDRASPTGSLSLSPTNSMASFPFADQVSPARSVFTQAFTFNSPPASPHSGMSPVTTPSPPPAIISPTNQSQNQSLGHLHGKHSPTQPQASLIGTQNPTSVSSSNSVANSVGNVSKMTCEEARLPVFNRLSSTVEAFTNLAI